MSESGLAIELRALRKCFASREGEVVAVDGLDMVVERGSVFGLLGPNGAGKTTTVEICEGLQEPTDGEVRILGRTWGTDDVQLRERCGVSLQETRFFDKHTVRELVDFFASLYRNARPADEVVALVGLEEKAGSRFLHLSGGQKQRLAVACALVGRPELLFLDEPTTGLDPQSRRRLWDVVRDFKSQGGTVVLTTHYMEEAAALCDRLMVIDHGRAIAEGSPKQLIAELGGGHVVEVEAAGLDGFYAGADLGSLPSVRSHSLAGDRLTLTVDQPHRAIPALLERLSAAALDLLDLHTRHTSLEDVFVHLTGRHIRDDGEAR